MIRPQLPAAQWLHPIGLVYLHTAIKALMFKVERKKFKAKGYSCSSEALQLSQGTEPHGASLVVLRF